MTLRELAIQNIAEYDWDMLALHSVQYPLLKYFVVIDKSGSVWHFHKPYDDGASLPEGRFRVPVHVPQENENVKKTVYATTYYLKGKANDMVNNLPYGYFEDEK